MMAKTWYCVVLVSQGGWYQVTVSFRFPPLQLPPVSWTIKQHARARAAGYRARMSFDLPCTATPQQVLNLQ